MPRLRTTVPTLLLIAAGYCAAAEEAGGEPKVQTGETVTAVGAKESAYTATTAQTATRTDVPLAETPLSVQVVPSQVFTDQGDIRMKDALRNISGVAPSKTEQNAIQFETAYIRGFSQLAYVDGVQFYAMPTVDLAGVDRIEVLKGPSSSMYGGMEPGGLVNVVPKTPEFSAHTDVSGLYGSYDFYRAEVDSTGPITDNLAYRLVGSFQDNDSFRDFVHQRSEFVSPSLAWNPTSHTRISTYLWYQHLVRPQDQGVVFTFQGAPVGPISRNLAGPNNENKQTINDVVYNIQVEQDITDALKVRGKFVTHYFDGLTDAIRWSTVTAANRVTPNYDNSAQNDKQFDFIFDADYRVAIGATKHELLVGTELNRNDYHYNRNVDATLPSINIFDPVYPHGPYHTTPGAGNPAEQHTFSDTVAGYVQDQMTAFGDRLHLLAGGRVDHINQTHIAFQNGNRYDVTDTGYSARAGAMYDVAPWMSPYANVGSSFNPISAGQSLTFDGEPLDPTTGVQYEGGLKFSFLEKRVVLTTSVYQITKDDVAIADPDHVGFSLNGGKMRSRGWEIDTTGQITPELQLIGSYGRTDTEVITSSSLPEGATFINIPHHSGSLWMNYTIQDGPLADLGIGLGAFGATKRAGDNANSFYLQGYTRIDAGAWYTFGIPSGQKVKLQLNVTNLLDKTYYESSASAGSVQPGTPLSVLGKATVQF